MVQNEAALENEFIHQLNGLGYATVDVKDEASLLSNLRELDKYAEGLDLLRHLEFSLLSLESKSTIPSKEVFLAIREYLRFKNKKVIKFRKQPKKVEKDSMNTN